MQYPSQLAVPAGSRTRTSRVAALIVAAAVMASSSALAQAPAPRPGASTPVQVENTPDNPVPVTGEVKVTNKLLDVAVVNDMVTKPYLNNRSLAFSGSDVTSFSEFDVPDGMRLIVETITVRVAVRNPGNAIAQFGTVTDEGFSVGGDIAMQPQGSLPDPFGTASWLIGTHSTKLRIDARPGEDDELVISFRTTGTGILNAFVAGYLVPLQ